MDAAERQIKLAFATEAMTHARHSQQMRATYLNFYLVFCAAALGAIALLVSSSGGPDDGRRLTAWAIAGFIWLSGVMTLIRTELWTAHFHHDRTIAKRLRRDIEGRPWQAITASDDFKRSLWSPNKSGDSLGAAAGAVGGAMIVWAIPAPGIPWLTVGIGCLMAFVPLELHFRLVRRYAAEHNDCCLTEEAATNAKPAAVPSSTPAPKRATRRGAPKPRTA